MKDFKRTWHLRIDITEVQQIIHDNIHRFVCPFDNIDSYLNIYSDKECDVQFLNLQHCDYTRAPSKDGEKYIKYLMTVARKTGDQKAYNFLQSNYTRFCIETNEENFVLPTDVINGNSLVNKLQQMWGFDASDRSKGNIVRARIVRLGAGGSMPWHRDETSDSNIRVICPIVTNRFVRNVFRDKHGERSYHFPASGHFFTFDDTKIEHAVFNESDIDRFALIFTVVGINNLKCWDREFYKNELFWNNWSKGI